MNNTTDEFRSDKPNKKLSGKNAGIINEFNSGLNEISSLNEYNLGDDSEKATVISARGTEDGLILRIDGKAEWDEVLKEIDAFLGGKKRFFEGGEISIEWLERLPTKEQSQDLEKYLRDSFGIGIVQRKRRLSRFLRPANPNGTPSKHSLGLEDLGSKLTSSSSSFDFYDSGDETSRMESSGVESLLDRVERLASGEDQFSNDKPLTFNSASSSSESTYSASSYAEKVAKYLGTELVFDEEANARIIFGTLRSGQRIETPFSLIVIGDVNPGADIIAGGDVIVMGSLRGTAHAGAYEDDILDRVVVALQMQPMQLRIGSVVSRGSGDAGRGPEVAKIDNRMIVVEPYSARALSGRKNR